MPVALPGVLRRIKPIDAAVRRSDPEHPLFILPNRGNPVRTHAVRIGQIMPIARKRPACCIKAVEAIDCPHPKRSVAIYAQGRHAGMTQTLRVVLFEGIARPGHVEWIKRIQAVGRADPKPLLIAGKRGDVVVAQAVRLA